MPQYNDIMQQKTNSPDLDKIDRYILFALDLEARQSAAEIARALSVSKETINHRIARLEKQGIISNYSVVVNIAKLGLTPFGVFSRLECISDSQKATLVSALEMEQSVYSVALLGGNYDLFFAIQANSIIEFDRILTRVSNDFSEHFGKVDISIRIEVSHLRRGYLVKRNAKADAPYFGRQLEQETLDDLELRILQNLARNARCAVTELSRSLGVPRSTVQARIKSLEKRKIIQSYISSIHPERYGYQIFKLLIHVDRKTVELRDQLFLYCNNHPNVTFFVQSVGKWDFELTCEVGNPIELQGILSHLRASFPKKFADIETVIIFDNMVKYSFF